MSNEIHDTQTPSGAFRRALFDPCFSADDDDDNVTFDDIPLNSTLENAEAQDFGDPAPSSYDSIEARAQRPVFTGLVALGVMAGGGTLAALTMFALLLAGLYAMSLQTDDGPQITDVQSGPVDAIRD